MEFSDAYGNRLIAITYGDIAAQADVISTEIQCAKLKRVADIGKTIDDDARDLSGCSIMHQCKLCISHYRHV